MPIRQLLALSLAAAQVSVAGAEERHERGHALVTRLCAQCHAVGTAGSSPHPAAPVFRRLQRTLDFNGFVDRLQQGLMVAHPDMPTFRFTRQDARAVAAYLSSIQQSGEE